MHHFTSLTTLALVGIGCAAKTAPIDPAVAEAVAEAVAVEAAPVEVAPEPAAPVSSQTAAAEVQWMPANPDSPDGPHLALLSGNPAEGAFTFMARFPAGYTSPIHSHPASFAGVSVSGTLLHGRSAEDNNEVSAGMTWTQPAEEVHYTGCAEGADCVIAGFMEGAMGRTDAEAPAEGEMGLVIIAADAVDFQPINPKMPDGPKMFVINGDRATGAFQALVKLPAGSASPNHNHSHTYSATVLSGSLVDGDSEPIGVGSIWTNIGGQAHITGCVGEEDCVFFASMDGAFDMNVIEAPAEE
jgi:quercetin dioxygenase-like cupin family protein